MIPERFELDDMETWHELDQLDKIAVLKATISVPDVASMILGEEFRAGDKIPSPWNPEERTPSCHLYDDHFYDYSTGKGGDIFDLLITVNPEHYTDVMSVVRALYSGALKVGKEYGEVEQQKPREIQNFGDQLPTQTLQTDTELHIIPEFDVRLDPTSGDILVPHRDPDGVYGVKVRYRSGSKGSWAGSQFMHRLYDPFGWKPGYTPKPDLIVCEGESDSWALATNQNWADVLALPSGAGSWKDHWLDDLKSYVQVWVCMDNDRAGQDARQKLMGKLGWARTRELRVPQLYNDARSAINAGWVPQSS